jgi:hypothetical protein
MRLLLFSDLRLDSDQESARNLTRICALARELQVDAVCSGGNLFQGEPDFVTSGLLQRAFSSLTARVFLVPGRLDWWHPGSIYADLAGDNVHVFTEPRLRYIGLDPGLTLWGAAHTRPIAENFLDPDEDDISIGGIHLGLFHGCQRDDFAADQRDGLTDGPLTAPFETYQVNSVGLTHALAGGLPTPRHTDAYTCPGWATTTTGRGGVVLVTVDPDGSITRERHDLSPAESPVEVAPMPAEPSWAVPYQAVPQHASPSQADGALPTWALEVLHPDEYDPLVDPDGAVWTTFVREVTVSLPPEDQPRVLRAGLLAMHHAIDPEGT